MDINELLVDTRLPKLRINVKEKYGEFQVICSTLSKLTSKKMNQMGEEFLNQAMEFFDIYKFNIAMDGNNIINIENELSKIKLELYKEDGCISFRLDNNEKHVYKEIAIQPEFSKEDMVLWKINIREFISNKEIAEIVNEIYDVNRLRNIINDIQINIDWYSKTIEEFESIDYIYADARSEDNVEYKNFEDFFNKI